MSPKKYDSTSPLKGTDNQDEFDYHVIKPDGLSERREAQNPITRKGQNKKRLLESISERVSLRRAC